jgi:hypothetical protein
MPKIYLHATGPNSFEWVDSPEKADGVFKPVAEATLKQFKSAELVELPQKSPQLQSEWVISANGIVS